jgi:flagellar hook-basal body complex protein FliE
MKVELLQIDAAPMVPQRPTASAFAHALDAVGSMLDRATVAEDSFANGKGSLQEAVYRRAEADVALSVATAVAQRSAQALTALLNMQI